MRDSDADPKFEVYQRQLALVDQIIGLQAALAEESARTNPDRRRLEQLEAESRAFHSSATWKVGRLMMAPWRLSRKLLPKSRKW